MEYVDNEYEFAFQFPQDWKVQRPPTQSDAGEVRVTVKHPTRPTYVMVTVGQIGKSITEDAFHQNRELISSSLIDFTVEMIYKRTSRDIDTERIVIAEKRDIPSDVGIKFYIASLQITEDVPMTMAGIHVIPFDKPCIVAFLMITPASGEATSDSDEITEVFNSFHMIGEKPE
jgi:hypothetical protein